nr:unnamed protein product [Callosobruchus chinensis]
MKFLGFWRSSRPNSIYNSIWYRCYTFTGVLLQSIFIGLGFMYLYDKWECLSLIDINSVLFIYSSEVINLSMMILIFFNIEVSIVIMVSCRAK